jgi:uncharacterized protein (DUF608 family)
MVPLNPEWPVLNRYDGRRLRRIALPLGGIGTGTVSLGGRGDLRDWEVMNRPAKGFAPPWAFFALYAKAGDAPAVARALEGAIDPADYEGATGSPLPNAGLPRFRECAFHAAYPLAQVTLEDSDVPVAVRLEAFNPFVPGDADASGFPAAVLRYVLINRTEETVSAAVCGSLPPLTPDAQATCIGRESGDTGAPSTAGLQGVLLMNAGDRAGKEEWGTLALATTADDVTRQTHWRRMGWNVPLLDFWDDFSADGRVESRWEGVPHGAVAASVTIPPGEERAVTFLLTWHFPNRRTWTPVEAESCGCAGGCADPNFIGNYYCTQFPDAWDAAERLAAELPELEANTVAFTRAFCESDLPETVKEAALCNLSTLRSQTCFRTPDGHLFGWEGCHDTAGCCHGSCTHVWNYEQATAFLFGDLSRGMREVEFLHATREEDGLMCFRVGLPLERAQQWPHAAADGQLGCLLKLYRDWQLSGDEAWLRKLWPPAKKALAFCWIPGGWDADEDGVMEGCQHNTMDVEYFGPNPQMGAWYLGALRAGEEMARAVGDEEFAARCRDLFKKGSAWTDAHLFNGEYYEQQVRPLREEQIAPGLRIGMGAEELANPPFQLGAACLVDQLVGQYFAHVCGLGYLLDRENVRETLRSILRYNFRRLDGHFNHMRTYALGDEEALLMATYPYGERPRVPFPYFTEVMTGFEYTAAVGMLYEGQVEEGLQVITAIRARYDGERRNPFDEAECGHHYARAMASWAAVLALTGFHYSGVTGAMTFAPRAGTHFWSTGAAWGTCALIRETGGWQVEIKVLGGTLRLRRFVLTDIGAADPGETRVLPAEAALVLMVPCSAEGYQFS